ncbi:MAG: bifunctional DNA-binding transcriptional regulator/O6-methylguanine-DNA methyltransferase Ada [Pseudomonadota bacterium]
MNTDTSTAANLDFDSRWAAVLDRDAAMDGRFVYAVRSTAIYCLPSCPSRRPLKKNVAFFDSPGAAEAAGFRACRRCRPTEWDGASSPRRELVVAACRLIDAAEDAPTLDALALALGVSASHLHRQFKRALGITPKAYARARQVRRLQDNLRTSSTVTEAIYSSGFGSSSRVYECSDTLLGMSPGAYKAGGAGVAMRYTTQATDLGLMLLAATDRGVSCIEFGDDPDELVRSLAARFPRAHLEPDDAGLAAFVAAIEQRLASPTAALDLPLDIAGTAFQQAVWKALRAIPIGTTVSYGEVAAAIGKPAAQRAVARACAENKLAVVVPCHRVVRADGSLGGYRWGAARKRRLLDDEAAAAREGER